MNRRDYPKQLKEGEEKCTLNEEQAIELTQILPRLHPTVVRFRGCFQPVGVYSITFTPQLAFDNQIPNDANDDNGNK